ncbi:helix-turn-helix domain-containing protein [Alienimonas sp. DA493]|uniref:helix-turn-helix domain-containing protein n=1 Tax=Alienimonas sp. DA493 TaxID=3373605 RepID=UPI003754F128
MPSPTVSAPAAALAARLKAWRAAEGLSQRAAGERLDPPVHFTTWAGWERGERWPQGVDLERLASLMGVSPGEAITPPG